MSSALPLLEPTYASRTDRIAALMRRERQSRFAASALGYFWSYLTPLTWIALVVIVFRLLERATPLYVPAEIFVATGILPYLIFRYTITSMSRSLVSGRYMLYFQPVSSSELLLASALLELINMFVTAIVIFGLITLLFDAPLPADPFGVLIALGLAWALGAGFGRLAAVLVLVSDSFARAIPIILRPLFWLSGIFYTASELPGAVQSLLWYSPTFHIVELLRESYFRDYSSPVSSLWYPVFIALLLALASVPLERRITARRASRYRL
ncbi:ABC transporter permease [Aestuariibius insulae]|uniref:ABC transporter permease n=1 Tax=Aestuariibius insulae TaxID=2058287 RepID=UPI00345E3C24